MRRPTAVAPPGCDGCDEILLARQKSVPTDYGLPMNREESPYLSVRGEFNYVAIPLHRLGIMAIIVGFECLVIESASIHSASDTNARSFMNPIGTPSGHLTEWKPKEWFPWAFLERRWDHDSLCLHPSQALVRLRCGLKLRSRVDERIDDA